MYTNNKGFGLKDLIIKIILVALFVLLLIWLFRNYSPNMKPFYSNVFRENISYMKDAAKSYFTNDELPTEVGQSVRLTLKQMEDMNLIIPFVDKDGNSCDVNNSYAEATKEQSGYTLKVNLVCGKESNYIIEILGCYDYCDNCNKPTEKTALEYEFKRTVSKGQTVLSCPKGYSRNGSVCTKKTGTETIAANKVYTKESKKVSDVLYTTGASQTIEIAPVTKTVTITSKQYADVTKNTNTSKEYIGKLVNTTTTKSYTDKVTGSTTKRSYVDKVTNTTTTKSYTDKLTNKTTTKSYTDKLINKTTTKSYTDKLTNKTTTKSYVVKITNTTTTKSYTDYIKQVTQNCHDERIKDPNCKVECKWVTGSNGIPQEVCNTCGYVTHKVCSDVTSYICPNGYISEGSGSSLKCYKNVTGASYVCPSGYTSEGSGANLKCYKNVTSTTYSCPSGYIEEGSGSSLKCYKNVTSTTYSCPSGYTKEGSGSSLKCYKNVTSTTYSCPSGYTKEGSGSSLKCYKDIKNAQYSCPNGYIEEGSGSTLKCYKNITNTVYSCPSGYTKEGSGSSLKCYKNVTSTTYSCGSGLTQEGSGEKTRCYKNVNKTTTTYSCSSEATSNNGKTGTALKCYKKVSGEKVAYCENAKAKIENGKCVLVTPSEFSHYTCKDGYTLNSSKGTCSKDIVETVKATSTTSDKEVTETKWSSEKTLAGWTATGKTRTVKVK